MKGKILPYTQIACKPNILMFIHPKKIEFNEMFDKNKIDHDIKIENVDFK
jgi:hypothetical protein